MSVGTVASGQAVPPAGARSPASAEGLRTSLGVTTIDPEVVEKVATRAAAETEGVAEVVPSGGGLGRLLHVGGEKDPASASADVERESTTLDLTVHVKYPEPALTVAESVRRNVIARVQQLTGLTVEEVNVTVPQLVVGGVRPRPRVQ